MAPFSFHFYRGEDGDALAHHLWGDGDRAPADQVGGASGKAELHGPAGAWVGQLAHLIAEEAKIGAGAECEADALL